MKAKNAILVVLALTVIAALFLTSRRKELSTPPPPAASAPARAPQPVAIEERIPPYHASADAAKPLPKTLAASQFALPVVARAYGIAQRIPTVLAQQPCYCWCDKFGHGSLLDCYQTDHGAG